MFDQTGAGNTAIHDQDSSDGAGRAGWFEPVFKQQRVLLEVVSNRFRARDPFEISWRVVANSQDPFDNQGMERRAVPEDSLILRGSQLEAGQRLFDPVTAMAGSFDQLSDGKGRVLEP